MLTVAAALIGLAACWYLLGCRYCRCDRGGDAQGRAELAFAVVFAAPAAVLAGAGLLVALLGLACPCRGADANVSARAALALAQARRQNARLRDTTKTPPAAPPCACSGSCRCEKGKCRCSPAGACSRECGCGEIMHPRTKRADDGGPDWTYDPARKGYYRRVPAPAPAAAPTPAPVFQAPAFAPPAFFRPPMMMGGGGACRSGG